MIETTAPQCERCGRCLSVCPVYREERMETHSPRGRLELIRAVAQGGITPGQRHGDAMSSCLQCLSCHQACPKGVDAPALIRAEKARMTREGPKGSGHLEAVGLKLALDNRSRLAAMVKVAGVGQRVMGSHARHLPLFLHQSLAGKQIPKMATRNIHRQFPGEISSGAPKESGDHSSNGPTEVLLFTGCFFGFVNTAPARAAIQLLSARGIKVHLPKAQACCGAPADLSGHGESLARSARKNLDLFGAMVGGDPDHPLPILTLCATCGNALKKEYPKRFPDSPIAQDLGSRVMDVCDFFMQLPGFAPGPIPVETRVTIHRPCHLNRGMGTAEAVERLLNTLPGLEIHSLERPDDCCGGGGICALKNPKLSQSLGRKKAEDCMETGAEQVAAPCPGCMLQIQDSLNALRVPMKTIHPLELLAQTHGWGI
ncbi:MAG: (Fe-S)-binding protein [Desulfobacterales bacterium]|nr:(Fe-S)-binding protein [Desulfobacterales bacterium]